MSDSDYTKLLTDLWTKGGNAVTAAQQAMFKELAGRMPSAGPMTMPWQAFAADDPKLKAASEAFQKLMLAWKDLPATMTREGEKPDDRITAELLQRIFDPREWMSATGFMDDSIKRLSEGPQFADFGQIERKFLALTKAWTELRTASIEHQTNVLDAWTKAAGEFAGKLNEAATKGKPIGSRSDIVAMWVEIANRRLLEAQQTQRFLETQRNLLRASTELRIAQQELADFYSEVCGLPTRPDIDDLARMVVELRREVRAERRARRDMQRDRERSNGPPGQSDRRSS
jgi:hypothetical protein